MQIISYGADPEFFLEDKKGKIVSAIDVGLPSKENPVELEHCTVFQDNVAIEFNILPQASRKAFIDVINAAVVDVEMFVDELGLKLSDKIDHTFSEDQLKAEGANEFSCNPDFSAFTFGECPKINPEVVGGFRTVGGHLHLGLAEATGDHCGHDRRYFLIRYLDMYAGLYCANLEGPNERRRLYGQASKFRFTPYGVEYRTLSNFWLPKNSKPNLTDALLWHVDQALNKANMLFSDPSYRIPDTYFAAATSIDSDNKKRIGELYRDYVADEFSKQECAHLDTIQKPVLYAS